MPDVPTDGAPATEPPPATPKPEAAPVIAAKVAEPPPEPWIPTAPTYIVQAQNLGQWKNGDKITHAQLKALGTPDDRILDLQLQGHIIEVSE